MLYFYIFLMIVSSSFIYIVFNITNIILATILILNTSVISFGFYHSLKHKIITFDLIYWIFNYLFFIIAVIVQSSEDFFPNTLPVNTDNIIFGQFLILIWNTTYLLLRNKGIINNKSNINIAVSKTVANFYFILSTGIVLFIFAQYGFQFFLGYSSFFDFQQNESKANSVLISAAVNGIVLTNFVFQFALRKKGYSINKIVFLIALIELVYINSPFNTTRYYQGFIIILIIWLFYRKMIRPYLFSIILILGVLVVFSFLDVFMKVGYSTEIQYDIRNSLDQFNQLHFDAFASFLSTIEYTRIYGVVFGENILGSLLFFIPRNIWIDKPMGSGTRIGDYLMENYNLHFNNISNPLISEFYLAFGTLGVIMGAVFLAKLVNYLESKFNQSVKIELVYGILLSYLFIILRGSLIVAVSSIVGTIFFMVILPYLINLVSKRKNEKFLYKNENSQQRARNIKLKEFG
ncbi:O-antigen polymerase [Peribacillus asahii]|uniref:O-antigen polymerase n=1 Tax=Peribacillus asahii TaxID=228899 RepID=UPI0037FE6166